MNLKRFKFVVGSGRVNYPSGTAGWFMAEYISHALVKMPGNRVGPYSNGYVKRFDTDMLWDISIGRMVKFYRVSPPCTPHRSMQTQLTDVLRQGES